MQGEKTLQSEDYHALNRRLHDEWVRFQLNIEQAKADEDGAAVRLNERRLNRLKDEIISANRQLATKVAQKFLTPSSRDRHDDYIQAGLLGLWEAWLKWDPSKGTLGTFSRPYIEGRINRTVHIAERPEISYGDSTIAQRVRKTETALWRKLGRQPTHAELAEAEDVSVSVIARIYMPAPTSLDRKVGDGETTLADLALEISGPDPFATIIGDNPDGDERFITRDQYAELTPLQAFCVMRRTGDDGAPAVNRQQLSAQVELNRERLRREETLAHQRLIPAGVDADEIVLV